MPGIDQESSEHPISKSLGTISRRLSILPVLIITACADKVAHLLDNDNGEDFNLELVNAQQTVKQIPYTHLEAVTDESMDEESFDGYGVGIFIDDEMEGEWELNKDAGEILVTSEFWCKKALEAINIYNTFELKNKNCLQDSKHCSEIDCSKTELMKSAMALYEEEQEEEDEDVEQVE